MSGTRNQARRRSAEGAPLKSSSTEDVTNDHEDESTLNEVTVGYGSAKYTLHVPDPDSNEIAKALECRGVGGKRTEKQDLLEYFVTHKHDISARLPSTSDADDMRDALDEVIPASVGLLKKKSVSQISTTIVEIYELLIIAIRDFNFRQTKTFNDHFNKLETVYLSARKEARLSLSKSVSKIVIKVSIQEQDRKFMVNGSLPPDIALRTCPFCDHDAVDLPDTNIMNDAENIRLLKEWTEKCNEYTTNTKNNVTTTGTNGKTLVKAPKRPVLKSTFFRCHCSQMRCLSKTSQCGNTCKNKCINPATNERYPFSEVDGSCTCPIHRCTCDVAFTADAFTAVPQRAFLDNLDQTRMDAMSAQKTQSKLSYLMKSFVTSHTRLEIERTEREKTAIDEKRIEDSTYESFAQSIVKAVDPRVDAAYVRQLRSEAGQPTTRAIVTKMTGESDLVNTRFIAGNSNSNHRGLNNQLTKIRTTDYGYKLRPNEAAYQLPDSLTPVNLVDITSPISSKSTGLDTEYLLQRRLLVDAGSDDLMNRIYSRCLKRAKVVNFYNIETSSVSREPKSPGASTRMRDISANKILAKDICSGLKQARESINSADACDAVCDVLEVMKEKRS